MSHQQESILSEVIAASLGGAVSASVLYPLEVLKTKRQAQSSDESTSHLSIIEYCQHLLNTEGYQVFWRGCETSAFQSALEKSLYFLAYESLKTSHRLLTGHDRLDGATNLFVGYLSEWLHLPITLPVDAWTTKIQTTNQAPIQILCHMLSDKNDTHFYKGLSAYWLLCFKPALQYTVYEQLKTMVLASSSRNNKQQQQSLTAAQAFGLGMVARIVATVLVFPFLRAKVLLQTQATTTTTTTTQPNDNSDNDTTTTTTKPPPPPAATTLSVLQAQVARDGVVAGLYQGIGPELTRGVFSSALMLMIKERLGAMVRARMGVVVDSTTQKRGAAPN